MMYVALSRATSMAGLQVQPLNFNQLILTARHYTVHLYSALNKIFSCTL